MSSLPACELFDIWLEFKATHCAEKTVEEYYRPMKRTLIEFFGEDGQVDRRQATKCMGWLRQKNLKPETVKRRLEAFNACYEWGMDEGYIDHNPWMKLSRLIKASKSEARPFSKDEAQAILRGFEEMYPEHFPLVDFLFGTGCRIGEGVGLQWSDVHHGFKQVTIATQLTREGERKPVKNGKPRTINLSPRTTSRLMIMHEIAPRRSGLIFTYRGQHIDNNGLLKRWIKVCQKKGVQYRKPYNTRHTFVSHCLAKGMGVVEVSAITGHDPAVLLTHYAGLLQRPDIPDLF